MISANVIHRTFRIRFGDNIGTGFTVDVDGRQYLITARHIIENLNGRAELNLFGNGTWNSVEVVLVQHSNDADISVVAPNRRLTPAALPLKATSHSAFYGQDVFFLGFPYYFLVNVIFTDDGYPLPFVKKAILSCFDSNIFLLDGHNNPGFSGGPVVFTPPGSKTLQVAAVVSGYKTVQEPVYAGEEQTPLNYRYNTGIIVAYRVDCALDIIRGNPIGFLLD